MHQIPVLRDKKRLPVTGHKPMIPIPLLKNQAIQRQINDLALQANEKRYQAYLLEQQALQIMDNEVIYAK